MRASPGVSRRFFRTLRNNAMPDNPHMTALELMFEKYHVSAGLFGHDHNYQHYKKNGVDYFITGSGQKAERGHHRRNGLGVPLIFAWLAAI
jgi:predicted phosphodiesterase